MISYKELGLVNCREMMKQAYEQHYAVPALNFVSIEQFNAIIDACEAEKSPAMFIISPNLCRQYGYEMFGRICQAGIDRLKKKNLNIPLCLHLDHGMTYEQCKEAIENGFSSVMIDGSALPFDENIALTRSVVEMAHAAGVTVEGELGIVSGAEEQGDEGGEGESVFTDPQKVEEFVQRTGVDCLAISIGTCHGLVKIRPDENGQLPDLRYDILQEVERRLPGFPIVLHGSSSIDPKYVKMINEYGGALEEAVGIPEEQLTKAAKMAVCKVNIASDGWIAALALTRKILAENPKAIDSRVFKLKVRPELAQLYAHKMHVLGSAGKVKGEM